MATLTPDLPLPRRLSAACASAEPAPEAPACTALPAILPAPAAPPGEALPDRLLPGRLISGEGTAEALWQAWPPLAQVPVRPLDWWVPAGTRLVVLAPHPDDEILCCGALLHQQRESGGECLVIAVTDGEASHYPSPQCSPAELAEIRRTESALGLDHVGVPDCDVLRLGLPDGQLQAYSPLLGRALARVLQDTDRLVTPCRLDGHPDHEACAQAAEQACQDSGAHLLQAPVWLWHWARPAEPSVPWHRLRGFRARPRDLRHKQHALAEHVSQTIPSRTGEPPALGQRALQRCQREVEYFFV